MSSIVTLFISLAFCISSGNAANYGLSTDAPETIVATVKELVVSQDKNLGTVNLCDPNGIKCEVGEAYYDSEAGRIYVLVRGDRTKYYAQKSNNSDWPYMIRFSNKWYYFSF